MAARTIEISVGRKTRAVVVEQVSSAPERFRVSWDDRSWEVDATYVTPSSLSLVLAGDSHASHVVECIETDRPGALDLYVDGVVVRALVDVARRFDARGGAAEIDGEQQVTAPMPGKVVRVLAKVGDVVAARQPVVVVEAMKMENELRSPCAGRVKSVPAREGASVDAGQILLVIDSVPAETADPNA